MRLEQTKNDVQTSGIIERARATIKATPKIFNFFENSTYSQKLHAASRELVANGIDSHVEAGIPHRAVEVTLPCELDPVFKVRDFGVGMTHDFLMGPYMEYGDGSTKDQSDNQIGGFGIGSKSPFAYTTQYTVRSVRDGQLGVYTVFKGEDGIPEIGCLGRTNTDEPSGVEVSFPVEVDDIPAFVEAAREALQYFKPLPVMINGELDTPAYTYEGADWAIRPSSGPLGVIMGGIRYPVSTSSLTYSLRSNEKLSPLLEYGLDLWMPIGACGVATSREHLQYTDKTNAGIQNRLELLVDDIVEMFANMFDKAPSRWEAMRMLADEVGDESMVGNARQRLLRNNAYYLGEKLESTVRLRDYPGWGKFWKIDDVASKRATTSLRSPRWDEFSIGEILHPNRIEAIVIDDLPQEAKSKSIAKIREYAEAQERIGSIYVFRGENGRAARLQHFLGNPEVVYTSSMPEPAKVVRSKKAYKRPRIRMFTFTGAADNYTKSRIRNIQPSMSKEGVVAEVPYAFQPDGGIYVPTRSFDLPGEFWEIMDSQLVHFSELHYVNAGDEPKLDKERWTPLSECFEQRLAAKLQLYPHAAARKALRFNTDIAAWWGYARDFANVELTKAQAERPFGRIINLWKEYVDPITENELRLFPFVKAAMPRGVDGKKIVEALENKQKDLLILLKNLELDNADHFALIEKNL